MKNKPSFTIEVGSSNGGLPVSFSEYQKIWNKNKLVPLALADTLAKSK